jgi:hypothetical protein
MLPEIMICGIPLVVIIPAGVQLLKTLGLPTRYAGLASIALCALILGLVALRHDPTVGGLAAWLLMSLVYGLAAAGFYSQINHQTAKRKPAAEQ